MTTDSLKEWARFQVENSTTMIAIGAAVLVVIQDKEAAENDATEARADARHARSVMNRRLDG